MSEDFIKDENNRVLDDSELENVSGGSDDRGKEIKRVRFRCGFCRKKTIFIVYEEEKAGFHRAVCTECGVTGMMNDKYIF